MKNQKMYHLVWLMLVPLVGFALLFATSCSNPSNSSTVDDDGDTDITPVWGESFVVDTDFGTSGMAMGSNSWTTVPASLASTLGDDDIKDIDFMDIAVDSEGNTYVAGMYYYDADNDSGTDNEKDILVAKYTPAGTLDTDFGTDGVFWFVAEDYTYSPNGENGVWDESWLSGMYASSVAVDSQDRVYVALTSYYTQDDFSGGYNKDAVLIRLKSDGSPDTSFSGNGIDFYGSATYGTRYVINGILIDAEDTPYIYGYRAVTEDGGSSYTYEAVLIEYGEDGSGEVRLSPDDNASLDGEAEYTYALEGDDVLYLGNMDGNVIEKWNTSGSSWDWQSDFSMPDTPKVIKLINDDQLLVYYSGNSSKGIGLYSAADGTAVDGFGTGGIVDLPGDVYDVSAFSMTDDGDILAFGSLKDSSDDWHPVIFRLNGSDGSPDSDFGTDGIITIDKELTTWGIAVSSDTGVYFSGIATENSPNVGIVHVIPE